MILRGFAVHGMPIIAMQCKCQRLSLQAFMLLKKAHILFEANHGD